MPKKLTQEIFLNRINIINPNIIILGEYKNNSTKIECKCILDGRIWYARPNSLLNGNGCPQCKNRKTGDRCRISQEEFEKKIFETNPNIKIIGEYKSNQTKIDCYCIFHDTYFSKSPQGLFKGAGCKKCGSENYSKMQIMPKGIFLDKFKIFEDKYELIGEYITASTLTKFRCKKDDHEWLAKPWRILKGVGCPKCSGLIKTNDEFVEELKNKNSNFLPLEPYKNSKTKILMRCLIDNYEWKIRPNDALNISGCPYCKKIKMQQYLGKTHSEFIEQLRIINPYIEILGIYIGSKEKILCRCLIDGHEWNACASHLLHYHGCPKCYQKSRGEKVIENILRNYNISFVSQKRFSDCKFKYPLSFDFYLNKYNICIEYQGNQHYIPVEFFGGNKSLELQKIKDEIKREYCIDTDKFLLEIPYWDFNNIEDILKNKIFQSKEVLNIEVI